jgi:hypothetical protein
VSVKRCFDPIDIEPWLKKALLLSALSGRENGEHLPNPCVDRGFPSATARTVFVGPEL